MFIRIIVLLLAMLFSGVALADDTRIWLGNDKVNQAANTVLVTSGSINEGAPNGTVLRTKVVVSSTVNVGLALRLLNASDVVQYQIKFGVAANDPKSDLIEFDFDIPNNYKWDLINTAAYTGTIHAHILGKVISGY